MMAQPWYLFRSTALNFEIPYLLCSCDSDWNKKINNYKWYRRNDEYMSLGLIPNHAFHCNRYRLGGVWRWIVWRGGWPILHLPNSDRQNATSAVSQKWLGSMEHVAPPVLYISLLCRGTGCQAIGSDLIASNHNESYPALVEYNHAHFWRS